MMLKQALQQKCVITLHEKQKKNTQRMARSQTGSTTRSKTGDLTKKDGLQNRTLYTQGASEDEEGQSTGASNQTEVKTMRETGGVKKQSGK